MTLKLIKNGNSKVLTINKTMREHLGVTGDTIEAEMTEAGILLKRNVLDVEQFAREFVKKHDKAMTELAK